MKKRVLCTWVFILGFGLALPLFAADLPGTGEDAGKTVVYRDTWGVPHIYAPTVKEGLYAMGWAQAEDRPEELLKNLLRGMGESARFEGKAGLRSDTVSHMWDHYGIAKRNAEKISPEVREELRAFADGMNAWYAAHPEDVPAWWGDRKIDEFMFVAFSRLFLYSWSIDDAFGDLQRGGIQPGIEKIQRGSNQWAVSPQRSATGTAILYIDPHLSWWGPSRFWECRIHAGDLHGSGFTLPGSPYIGLGHNAEVAWAMTTGGPDTADIYELTLKEDDPTKYMYDGEWRQTTMRQVTIPVKDADPETITIYECHLGPIVALRNGKGYAAAVAYADVVELNEAWFKLNFAKDYTGAVDALATTVMFPQNVMVADTSGNIYYQRTGRVPKRPEGYDWDKPVDGSTSATAWQGFHPASDHVQLLNPEQGYMQNCNIPPDAMIVDSPLTPDKYPSYIYGGAGYGPRGGWSNQRGARAVELLSTDASVTIDEALAYAVDVMPYDVERWIALLRAANEKLGAAHAKDADYAAGVEDLLGWDLRLDRDSTGALKYFYWKEALGKSMSREAARKLAERLDQPYLISQGQPKPALSFSDAELEGAIEAIALAMTELKAHFGSLNATYGDKFRVGRDDKSWPLGGGGDSNAGVRTLRSISYGGENEDHTRWGRAGQTSTQIVVMTKPVQSWTGPPIGQSDRPDSPHYTDQAEKNFSKRQLKPTWWMPEDLAGHVESRVVVK